MYAAKPDAALILSPHGSILPDAFALLISPTYRANLKEFGDFSTALEFRAELTLIERIRQLRLQNEAVPVVGVTDEFCDYGVSVPLYFLAQHLPNLRIVPMSNSELPLTMHFQTGQRIGNVLQKSKNRVAVIASADLAHTLTDAAPGGFSPEGKKFDETVVQALRKNDYEKIMALDKQMIAAKACGLRVIVMLLGMLDGFNCTAEPLSYEGPFGVGYLAARFNLR